jgi:ubiquinone/menaquinone biosynthesis C-methylase UbiE
LRIIHFDLAVCNFVLEFVDSPEKVIAEGLRVLKDGRRNRRKKSSIAIGRRSRLYCLKMG